MPRKSLKQVIQQNAVRQCNVSGCTKARVGVGYHCKPHAKARNLHGDPRGKSLHPKTYGPQRVIVGAFLQENLNHVGVQSALGWLSDWLENSCVDNTLPSASEMRRLYDAGVSALAVLTEAASVYLFARSHPHVINDGLRLTYAIGHAVLRLAPREMKNTFQNGRSISYLRHTPSSHRRVIGERVRLTLGGLLANIEHGLEARTAAQRAWEQSLRTPFDPQPRRLPPLASDL